MKRLSIVTLFSSHPVHSDACGFFTGVKVVNLKRLENIYNNSNPLPKMQPTQKDINIKHSQC